MSWPPADSGADTPTQPMPRSESGNSSNTEVVESVFGAGSYRQVDSDDSGSQGSSPRRAALSHSAAGHNIFVALWVLGTLVVLAAVVVAFMVGSSLAPGSAPPVEAHEPAVVELSVEFPQVGGAPRQPGVWAWDELRGGECVDPFEGAFAQEFRVVGCDAAHQAQLVIARVLSSDPAAVYPGDTEVLAAAREVCDVRGVLNYDIASAYSDLVVDFSYPVQAQQWGAGGRGVYCFIYRHTGEGLRGSLIG